MLASVSCLLISLQRIWIVYTGAVNCHSPRILSPGNKLLSTITGFYSQERLIGFLTGTHAQVRVQSVKPYRPTVQPPHLGAFLAEQKPGLNGPAGA